jgi:hypothetical protein
MIRGQGFLLLLAAAFLKINEADGGSSSSTVGVLLIIFGTGVQFVCTALLAWFSMRAVRKLYRPQPGLQAAAQTHDAAHRGTVNPTHHQLPSVDSQLTIFNKAKAQREPRTVNEHSNWQITI